MLVNDSAGGDGAPAGGIIATKVTDPSNGTLTLNSDGSLIYVPTGDYNGSDSFTYSIVDSDGDTNAATVTITVNSVDDTPVAANDTYSVDEDTTLTVVVGSGVLANDSIGGDGGTLAATKVTDPSNGTLILNTDGSLTYVPTGDYNGSDSFTYSIIDSDGDTDTATVEITVNSVDDSPVAQDDLFSVAEDVSLSIAVDQGILANDSIGGDGGTLAATKVTDPSNGTLVELLKLVQILR